MIEAVEIEVHACPCCGGALEWRVCDECSGAGYAYGMDVTGQPWSTNCPECKGRRGGYRCVTCLPPPPEPQLGCPDCGGAMDYFPRPSRWICGDCRASIGGAR